VSVDRVTGAPTTYHASPQENISLKMGKPKIIMALIFTIIKTHVTQTELVTTGVSENIFNFPFS
jgi:hypothetical protein